MERRYHVGRVDGDGPIYRLESRVAAETKIAELVSALGKKPEDFYLDGPEEPTEAQRVSDLVKKFIHERRPDDSLLEKLMEAESDEDRERLLRKLPDDLKGENQFIIQFTETDSGKGIAKAMMMALKVGMPFDLAVALAVDLGYRTGLMMAEQRRLEEMIA